MSEVLTSDQIADLAGISQICHELGADLVVIGATSLLLHMGDLGRFNNPTVCVAGAPCLNPPTNNVVACELPEIAARVVQVIGLGGVAGKEGLVKRAGTPGIAPDQLFDLRRDRLQTAHERETLTVRNEGPVWHRGVRARTPGELLL